MQRMILIGIVMNENLHDTSTDNVMMWLASKQDLRHRIRSSLVFRMM